MHPQAVLAIMRLTLREAVRSRVLLAVTVLLLAGLLGLPALIPGDGTPTGRVHVLLHYALRYAVTLLAVGTMWAACASLAIETQDRCLQLLMAKPVRRGEIWLGKWLAIIGLNAGLLAVTGLLLVGALRWATRPAVLTPQELQAVENQILTARKLVLPSEEMSSTALEQRVAELIRAGRLPPEARSEKARLLAGTALRREARTVAPGASGRWTFHLSPEMRRGQPLTLRLRFQSSRPERVTLDGEWRIGPPEAPPVQRLRRGFYPCAAVWLPLPPAAIGADGTITAEFKNLEERMPATVIFEPDDGLQLFVHWGAFEPNLLRALLVIWCELAFLAALGLAAGGLFSLPVAVFVSLAILVVLAFGGYIERVVATGVFYLPHEGELPRAGPLDAAARALYRTLHVVTGPWVRLDAVNRLVEGRYIPWHAVGRALALLVGVYAGVTVAVGLVFFHRREIAATR